MTDIVEINTTFIGRATFEDGFGNPGSIQSESVEVVHFDGNTRTVISASPTLSEPVTGEYVVEVDVLDTLFTLNNNYFVVLSGITSGGQQSVSELISWSFRPIAVASTYSVDFS
jgi:hypothetical protein